jgi:transposase
MFRKQYTTRQKQTVLSYLTTHTPKETSIHHGIHISMVYKWNYSKDKINQASKKAVKPGAGRKPKHKDIEFERI